jgi:zinc/manganese transport system permease protein
VRAIYTGSSTRRSRNSSQLNASLADEGLHLSWENVDLTILLPAFAAGLLVTATHVPLGIQVLKRGIVFVDLAIAQIAALGVLAASLSVFEPHGASVQIFALAAALTGAAAFAWSEKRWPEVQEGTIGATFVVAASAAILLLARNPHGGEHLRDLLAGQILWVGATALVPSAIVTAAILAIWFALAHRMQPQSFYLLFACAVTLSVQLVGLYLVFATLIIPALATRGLPRRTAWAYAIAIASYLIGLVISALADLPSGAVIVCVMPLVGVGLHALAKRGVR